MWSKLGVHPGISKFLGLHAYFKKPELSLIHLGSLTGTSTSSSESTSLKCRKSSRSFTIPSTPLTFLHQLDLPIWHGDLEFANVLINPGFRAALCDFGLARLHEDSNWIKLDSSKESRGSIRWSSPGLVNGSTRTLSSDVYAWACLVWEARPHIFPPSPGPLF